MEEGGDKDETGGGKKVSISVRQAPDGKIHTYPIEKIESMEYIRQCPPMQGHINEDDAQDDAHVVGVTYLRNKLIKQRLNNGNNAALSKYLCSYSRSKSQNLRYLNWLPVAGRQRLGLYLNAVEVSKKQWGKFRRSNDAANHPLFSDPLGSVYFLLPVPSETSAKGGVELVRVYKEHSSITPVLPVTTKEGASEEAHPSSEETALTKGKSEFNKIKNERKEEYISELSQKYNKSD